MQRTSMHDLQGFRGIWQQAKQVLRWLGNVPIDEVLVAASNHQLQIDKKLRGCSEKNIQNG